ncbi:hypothetical protein BDN72DRAFT_895894 [Pluteus cervinus]|uniref:Uncharacterized protein n=1 Tax=Pluteus cervinus TaxID=181527 RepID=A0ACD3AZX4_9AGAR|nr:hypothetical protein BDN72DRAFT_895894 [Pluteus cervinus]
MSTRKAPSPTIPPTTMFSTFLTFILSVLLLQIPPSLGATYDVDVAPGDRPVFEPNTLAAEAGDVINFIFHGRNHTATQSTLDSPCTALSGGFDTGFVALAAGGSSPVIQYRVAHTDPVVFFSSLLDHCARGMTFTLNLRATPTSSSSLEDAYITPPPHHWNYATATVSHAASTWTTIYKSFDGIPPPVPSDVPGDHRILVGANNELEFSPSNISAAVGDTVTFEFRSGTHSVVQSDFLTPCQSLEDSSRTPGFSSGFRPTSASTTGFPQFQILINDTAPIWGFCGAPGHCGLGMVFSINAVESGPNNFSAFQGLARHINGSENDASVFTSSQTNTFGHPAQNNGGMERDMSERGMLWLGLLLAWFACC